MAKEESGVHTVTFVGNLQGSRYRHQRLRKNLLVGKGHTGQSQEVRPGWELKEI